MAARHKRAARFERKYGWRNAVERLQSIRHAIEREERVLFSLEWRVNKVKTVIARLEHDRDKVHKGLVRRP